MARWRWRRTSLGGEADRAAFRALHNASLASPALREGLTSASAERSVRHLRALLGTPAAGLGNGSGLLAWDGTGGHHRSVVLADSSKLDTETLVQFASLKDLDTLITDSEPGPELAAALEEAGVDVVIA